jgi:polyferredoxin
MKPKTVKRLDRFRQLLWAVLMFCLWTGIWFDWIDYEPFSAFIFQSASWVVIGIAIAFVLLSTIVMRPYCRFVCPTGTLFKISQNNK